MNISIGFRNFMTNPIVWLVQIFFLILLSTSISVNASTIPNKLREILLNNPKIMEEYFDAQELMYKERNWKESNKTWLSLLNKYIKKFGRNHPLTEEAAYNLGESYRESQLYEKALPLLIRAAKFSNENYGDHIWTAKKSLSLSLNYFKIGQYSDALAQQERALQIYKNSQNHNGTNIAFAMQAMASTQQVMGNYKEALNLSQESLRVLESIGEPDAFSISVALNNLAEIYRHLAQYQIALDLQKRALIILEEKFGSEHFTVAAALGNMALSLQGMDRSEEALPLLQRASTIYEKTLGFSNEKTALGYSNLATVYADLEKLPKTLELLVRSFKIYNEIYGPDHPDTALVANNLAVTYRSLDQYEEALQLQLNSLSTFQKSFGSSHPHTARSLANLAYIYLDKNKNNEGITLLKASVNIYQSMREHVSGIGASELNAYTQSVSTVFQVLASALTDQGRLAEAQLVLDMLKESEHFEFVRRSEGVDPRQARIGYNATEQVWVSRYFQIANRLAALGAEEQALQKQAKLGLTKAQKRRQQELAKDLVIARKAFESYSAKLHESFAKQGPARAMEVTETSQQALRDMQAMLKGLGGDSVLLQYYVTDDRVGMLLTTPGVQLARTTHVKAKDLNRQILEFRRMLRDPKANNLPAAQELYRLLLSPVEQDLEQSGAKTVMLSLDGLLRYLPFAALHDGKQHLIQRWNLPIYTSVTRDKLRDAVTPQWHAAGLGLTRPIRNFEALPAVKAELHSIVKTDATGVLPGEVYLDEAFSAARLKDVSQRKFQLVHVASHFQFSPGTEVNSFLLLGDGQQLTLGEIRTQNYRFDNVDLLTLSACDTGLGGGRDAQGREIEGFGVLAQQQGAKAVLATLWRVADQSTATLMADMYKQRQEKNLTKIEALRQAQLSLLSQPKYAHPFYWAPFILMGNWK
jgi:CHAT domain-containing protein